MKEREYGATSCCMLRVSVLGPGGRIFRGKAAT